MDYMKNRIKNLEARLVRIPDMIESASNNGDYSKSQNLTCEMIDIEEELRVAKGGSHLLVVDGEENTFTSENSKLFLGCPKDDHGHLLCDKCNCTRGEDDCPL